MSQTTEKIQESDKPLNARQKLFAQELGLARASGDKNYIQAYENAGFKKHRGNAMRLASDPRVVRIADELCRDALKRNGLQIEYLQAKALQLLDRSVGGVLLDIRSYMKVEVIPGDDENPPAIVYRLRTDLSEDERAEFEAKTWCLNDLKIDDKGVITLKMPDKKSIIEMLAKQLGVGNDKQDVNVSVTLEALVGASMKDVSAPAAAPKVVEHQPEPAE